MSFLMFCKNVIEYSDQETPKNHEETSKNKEKSFVVVSKIISGNVHTKPILFHVVNICDRFRKSIGLVYFLFRFSTNIYSSFIFLLVFVVNKNGNIACIKVIKQTSSN